MINSYLQTLLVTGGKDDGDQILSSTEILTLDTDLEWISAASLPSRIYGLSAATLENTVFVFGKIYNFALHLS